MIKTTIGLFVRFYVYLILFFSFLFRKALFRTLNLVFNRFGYLLFSLFNSIFEGNFHWVQLLRSPNRYQALLHFSFQFPNICLCFSSAFSFHFPSSMIVLSLSVFLPILIDQFGSNLN